MFIVYDLIFLLIALVYLPIYFCKGKFHHGFLSRLGFLPKDIELNNPIWIHAVSVGEVMAIRGLLEELRAFFPDKRFVISTVTPTGNKVARNIAQENDFVTYLPLDFSFMVRKVLDKINPRLFIIAETEIWPNLTSYLYKKNIPSVVVNGRISDSSFKGYLMIKFLLKPILNKINLFCVQTEHDRQRLIRLGVPGDKIRVTGNMKFDTTDYTDKKIADYTDYKLKLGLKNNQRILLAASTHPGEEKIILNVYRKLLADFSDLRLLIAPRHPERAKRIADLALKNGFNPIFISSLNLTPDTHEPRYIFILDTIGQLMNYYAIADTVFVGGSLAKIGGQNILEPASLGKPVIFGPYMFNFRDIADLFLENNAGVLVKNEEELITSIKDLLNKPDKREAMGKKARALILENQGATRKSAQIINDLCKNIYTS